MLGSKEQGCRRDDDSERLVRLFIVVPRTATEDELREHFKQFGDLDYVSIVRNRDTGESKGFAYIRYNRPYDAAKAYEECGRNYKAVFARPREPKPTHSQYRSSVLPGNSTGSRGGSLRGGLDHKWGSSDDMSYRLTAYVAPMLREQHIYSLFDIIPGLELCRAVHDPRGYNGGLQKVLIQYSNAQSAEHAINKLNGFEYPPGHKISIKPEPSILHETAIKSEYGSRGGSMNEDMGGGVGMMSGGGNAMISASELATLTKALAKAESIIKAAGLTSPSGDPDTLDPNYCSVKLPSPKPLAASTEPVERLFVVCQPGLPPMYALRDVFGRFGDLVEVYVLNGKNCGYVSYASKQSAEEAIATLHLQEVCGMRLKVMKAEPAPGGPSKRIRLDTRE